MAEPLVITKKLAVSVLFNTVEISLICADAYEAQVTFDDIVDRLRRGEGLTLSLSQPALSQEETA